MLKPIPPKEFRDICSEWDSTCALRQEIINEGKDISLIAVTAPCILKHVKLEQPSTVLDVGCGTGYLTSQIKQLTEYCCGIDASASSISIAKETYVQDGLSFIASTASVFRPCFHFDMCVSNMALTCDPAFYDTVKSIFDTLKTSGTFLAMITHPCFWPRYWGFDKEPWFKYNEEVYIEHSFSMSFAKDLGTTTFIHRPLEMYLKSFVNVGFHIEQLEEPYPVTSVPDGYEYGFPRFLFIKCRKP